ncbi:uroporphyrinogen-III synthase [Vagococcus hydrophili]|uniref:Uroporphyrinogen-III synthase n=1 Tax=Vagococcus hydrophili TaxID=2714947 RepID=A0A6G8AUK0_9ENTE|nr:uroporphyrinogen-III synthase [Vagococcus hydrophili]QIL48660.1 uroporphyrinogen-III synthase [Vagococcus hydrophili]
MLRTILYTREDSCPATIKEQFQRLGTTLIELPLIKTEGLAHCLPKTLIDWIFFTSSNTVKYLNQGLDYSKLKVASIGKKTSEALRQKGIQIDFEPSEAVAEIMMSEWLEQQEAPQVIFLPNSDLARKVIPEAVKKSRHKLIEEKVYHTYFPEESKRKLINLFKENNVDSAMFASPSAWRHFKETADEEQIDISAWQFYSIGPITSQAIEQSGAVVKKESKVHDTKHLYEVVLKEIKENGKIYAS